MEPNCADWKADWHDRRTACDASSGDLTEETSRRMGRIRNIYNFSCLGSGVQGNIDSVGIFGGFIV